MSSVLGVAGGVVQAFGQAYAAGSKANMMKSQARALAVAGQEQQEGLEFQAEFTEQQSVIRQDQIQRYGEKLRAKATTIAAASGVEPGGGSVVLADMDNAANVETDVQRTKFSSDLAAANYRWQGSVARDMAEFNADVMRREATVVKNLGDISFASTMLGSAAIQYAQSQPLNAPVNPYSSTAQGSGTQTAGADVIRSGGPGLSSTGDTTGESLLMD